MPEAQQTVAQTEPTIGSTDSVQLTVQAQQQSPMAKNALTHAIESYDACYLDPYHLAEALMHAVNKGRHGHKDFLIATRFCTLLIDYIKDNPDTQTEDLQQVFAEIQAVHAAVERLSREIDSYIGCALDDCEAIQYGKHREPLTRFEKNILIEIAAISANMRQLLIYAIDHTTGPESDANLLITATADNFEKLRRDDGTCFGLMKMLTALGAVNLKKEKKARHELPAFHPAIAKPATIPAAPAAEQAANPAENQPQQ